MEHRHDARKYGLFDPLMFYGIFQNVTFCFFPRYATTQWNMYIYTYVYNARSSTDPGLSNNCNTPHYPVHHLFLLFLFGLVLLCRGFGLIRRGQHGGRTSPFTKTFFADMITNNDHLDQSYNHNIMWINNICELFHEFHILYLGLLRIVCASAWRFHVGVLTTHLTVARSREWDHGVTRHYLPCCAGALPCTAPSTVATAGLRPP